MTAMLHCLLSDVADEVRAALPNGWAAANDEADLALIDVLTATRLIDDVGLMALLVRRADEERIASAARARSGRREARVLQGLVSHEDGQVSAAAIALILARGRRRDRFGQCLVSFDDLYPATAEALVHAIAAALRREIAATHGAAGADRELGHAASRVIAQHQAERSVDVLTSALVRLLDSSGSAGDELILAAAHEGEAAFVAEILARRAGLATETALEELLSGDPARLMALLRIAGVSRGLAAGLLAGVGDLLGIDDPATAITMFDGMAEAQADAARAWLVSAPAYRAAIATLGHERG